MLTKEEIKKIIKESALIILFCYSCQNSENCSLWEQVSEINEDFIKETFEYEPEVQSVGAAVNYCKLYQPKNK
ncbi:hypothetical protein QI155_10650 [Thermodesulfovibrio sp. 1176]|uniref:hypothetical protein n=1 Tax=Thermodesulfovibrio sp. 1176 TaxID=3043424 RepID=UPI0024830710|nr:hypothetical protein [Thermodesulfovibrio sp. 1176]MDI1472991.1 hypothetical protein [Thermodesulfovibrio sp. 1176]